MREMVGGCCVCSDEQGWNENPLVYCDGQGCTVAVHQACYGIVTVPTGPWYCRKCESQERAARVRCELCPSKDGALKRTDNGGWAHVVCALYIPEVRFGNVATMEPIILALVPQERYNKVCYLCLENSGRESKASHGACMQCNKSGCKDSFHVTCAQAHGLLCEEAGNYMDNVKYCGYCDHHFQRINKKLVKTIPAFRPAPNEDISPTASPDKQNNLGLKEAAKHLQASSTSKGKGKRGRKPGSMIYEPKLEPPKFNPDLASLSSSNNSLNNVGGVNNSVTLTPVSSFSNSNHTKTGTSFSNSETNQKPDKIFSEKVGNKTPNVVVKIGKHGEIYHAKKDSPHENNCVASPVERPGSSEAILERVTPLSNSNSVEVKEELSEKKGFTTANFTESFVTASVSVAAALIKSDSEKSPVPSEKVDTSKVKVELPDPSDLPESSISVDPTESVPTVHSTATVNSISSTSGRELPREPLREPPREPHREPPREPQRELPREPLRDSPREPHREPPRETNRDPPREPLREPLREPPRELQREAIREPIRKPPSEPHRELPRELPRETQRESPREPPREPPPVSEPEQPLSQPPVLPEPVSTSHQTIPQLKSDPKVTSASQSTGLTFSLEPQASVAPSKPTNSNSVTNMYNRTSLNNSVSLFPTSNTAAMAKSDVQLSQPHSSVSIIPSVTSNSSSLSSSTSSLTVTRTESSSPGSHSQTNNLGRSSMTQPVTISPVTSDERLPLESPNQVKSGSMTMISPRSKAKAGNGPVKRIGRPPKKGTHTTNSSLGNVINVESEEDEGGGGASKRARTDTAEKGEDTPKSEGTDNGLHRFMMFGATLNPASGMAKEMNTVLQNEVAAHSVYTPESAPQLVGVPLPGRRRTHESGRSAPHTVAGMLDPARQPQTLEELLERHWEQGSRFLMEQASHFDIASLLSSLHQLREENLGLEDSVDRLIARRDHLLAVRARLLALNSLTLGSLSQEARREPIPLQNGPTQPDRRLVSPSRPLVSPSRDKALPSPRDRGAPPIPSPRERPGQPSPRDRDRSPRLPHHPMENGLDPAYRHDRVGGAQLLSVAHPSNSNHRQHSPVSVSGPPKAHYSHNTSLPPGPPRHPELRGNYPSNYQMVSPPAPKGPVPGGAPLPAHSSHLPMVSRSTPPGVRNTPPIHGAPPSHHSLPPNMHPHMMRSSPQSTLHPKK